MYLDDPDNTFLTPHTHTHTHTHTHYVGIYIIFLEHYSCIFFFLHSFCQSYDAEPSDIDSARLATRGSAFRSSPWSSAGPSSAFGGPALPMSVPIVSRQLMASAFAEVRLLRLTVVAAAIVVVVVFIFAECRC